jgi:hypothetical protein
MSHNTTHDRALLSACLVTIIELGQQLKAVEQSHRQLVELLHERLIASVDTETQPHKAQVLQLRK